VIEASDDPIILLYREALIDGRAPTAAAIREAVTRYPDAHDRTMSGRHRIPIVRELAFGVPSAEAIEEIAQHGAILEIGAGTGLWANFIAKRGIDVIAIDSYVGKYADEETSLEPRHHPVVRLDAREAMRRWPDRTILMVWPDRQNTVGENVATAMRPGQTLLHVGESLGCTGTPGLDAALRDAFSRGRDLDVSVWDDLHDCLTVFIKQSPKSGI
jgi:hypothetical protein